MKKKSSARLGGRGARRASGRGRSYIGATSPVRRRTGSRSKARTAQPWCGIVTAIGKGTTNPPPLLLLGKGGGSNIVPEPSLTIEQRHALGEAAHGCTGPALTRRRLSSTVAIELVAAGYAVAEPRRIRVGGRTFRVTRFVITETGRRAIQMRDEL